MKIEGKNIVLTGGSSGIGLALLKSFLGFTQLLVYLLLDIVHLGQVDFISLGEVVHVVGGSVPEAE